MGLTYVSSDQHRAGRTREQGGPKPLHSSKQRGIAPLPHLNPRLKKKLSRICKVRYLYNPKDL